MSRTLEQAAEYLAGRDEVTGNLVIPVPTMTKYMAASRIDYKNISDIQLRHQFFKFIRLKGESNIVNDDLTLSDQLLVEKTKLAASQAKESEFRVRVKEGKLIPALAVTLALAKFGQSASSKISAIPLNLRRRIPHLTLQDIELINKELVTVQNSIADFNFIDEDDIMQAMELENL